MHALNTGLIDELNITKRISTANPAHPGFKHVCGLSDHFFIRDSDPENAGNEHACIVHEVMGPSLQDVTSRTKGSHLGLPMAMVKSVARQVLSALEYLHEECGVIHCGEQKTTKQTKDKFTLFRY